MKRIILIIIGLIVLLGVVSGLLIYRMLYGNHTAFSGDAKIIYIMSDISTPSLVVMLDSMNVIQKNQGFEMLANILQMKKIKSGRYKIKSGTSNIDMLRMFRAANQEPVNLTFNNIRTKAQFAEKISQSLQLSQAQILEILEDSLFLKQYSFTVDNIMAMFIPNTYQFYWTVSVKDFFDKMYKYYKTYWNTKRLNKAKEIGLSPIEVSILASIVEEENYRIEEQPRIAGLYINRLHKKMLLQSDPTVKYAMGDFSATQILYKDLGIDSPYNTYKYQGLPPGVIRLPESSTIDAVLNYEKHNYIYMCAKEDLSGFHNFAVTASQHAVNVRKYHAAYRKWKINQNHNL